MLRIPTPTRRRAHILSFFLSGLVSVALTAASARRAIRHEGLSSRPFSFFEKCVALFSLPFSFFEKECYSSSSNESASDVGGECLVSKRNNHASDPVFLSVFCFLCLCLNGSHLVSEVNERTDRSMSKSYWQQRQQKLLSSPQREMVVRVYG